MSGNTESFNAKTRAALATALVLMVSAGMAWLFMREIPVKNETLISLVLGGLITKMNDVYGYFFNSSANSHSKDVTLGKVAETASAMASVAATAQMPSTSVSEDLTLKPGQDAQVKAGETGGAVISKEHNT